MLLSHCQYWIFDLDGTLTVAMHDFDAIRDELGLPAGEPILEAMSKLPEKRAEQILQRLNEIEWELACKAEQQPGAHDLLEHLAKQGRQLGILTRNGAAIARKTLQVCDLDCFFSDDDIIGRELCVPKPNPSGIIHLLDRWNAPRANTVMVGDHMIDMQAGNDAGVKTVHFDHNAEFQWPELTDINVAVLTQLMPLCPTPNERAASDTYKSDT